MKNIKLKNFIMNACLFVICILVSMFALSLQFTFTKTNYSAATAYNFNYEYLIVKCEAEGKKFEDVFDQSAVTKDFFYKDESIIDRTQDNIIDSQNNTFSLSDEMKTGYYKGVGFSEIFDDSFEFTFVVYPNEQCERGDK
ncbi:MAG: hypothetical protein ACK5KQ_04735 [Anaerorhabdus sp.]